jgi:N-acetylglutamate synthase-like GNAT family acetyltransferase
MVQLSDHIQKKINKSGRRKIRISKVTNKMEDQISKFLTSEPEKGVIKERIVY